MARAPRTKLDPRERLVRDAQRGGVTLVLGAGVSFARGVPGWSDLAADLLYGATGERPAWLRSAPDDWVHLEQARERLRGVLPDDFLNRLQPRPREPHPLALPMVFERVEAAICAQMLTGNASGAPPEDGAVDDTLATRIREAMYRNVHRARGDTLAVLADVLRRDQARAQRRVVRVITFNADDLLEQEAHHKWNAEEEGPIVWWIARASHQARVRRGAWGLPPIPVYHVHGFLPQEVAERQWADAPDTLVFTDAQYWQSVASPLSFANRVVAQALHDSHCVFIGLSMTDINLMRWLGVRYEEIMRDRLMQREANGGTGRLALHVLQRNSLLRHSWVRVPDGDPDARLLEEHLLRRGVASVNIPGWGQPFKALLRACFPDGDPA